MTDSIQDVVTTALHEHGLGSYAAQAAPVVTALEARERQMAEGLIEFAVGEGMDRASALGALNEVGMTVPSLVGTVASAQAANAASEGGSSNDDIVAALNDIATRIDGLTTFARQNGYTG